MWLTKATLFNVLLCWVGISLLFEKSRINFMLKYNSTADPLCQGLPVPASGKYFLCAFAALGRYPLSTHNWWLPPGMMSELLVPVYPDWCGLLARWQLVGHVVLVCHNIMYQPHMYHWFQLLKTLYFLGGVRPCPTVPPAASDALPTDYGA